MPMAIAVKIVVMMNLGVILDAMVRSTSAEGVLMIQEAIWKRLQPDGLSQRVIPNTARSETWEPSRNMENSFDRNKSSPTNRQFTVHLKRNCRINWNARDRYPIALSGRNGKAIN